AAVDVVRRVAGVIAAPLTVGGGIGSVENMQRLFDAGAAKVSLGSAAVARPELIKEGADAFGRERMVVAIDCRRRPDGGWEVFTHGGRTATGLDAVEWARRAEALGAGWPERCAGAWWLRVARARCSICWTASCKAASTRCWWPACCTTRRRASPASSSSCGQRAFRRGSRRSARGRPVPQRREPRME